MGTPETETLPPDGVRILVNRKERTVAFVMFVDREDFMTLEYTPEGVGQLIEALEQALVDLEAAPSQDHQGERQ